VGLIGWFGIPGGEMVIELMLITVLAIASIGLAMFLGSSKKKPRNKRAG
jgi:hypothetical protein